LLRFKLITLIALLCLYPPQSQSFDNENPTRHSTIDLESKVFTPKDWEKLAGVTEESIQMEEKLFLNAKLSAPEGCDPESFPPLGHHQKPS